MPDSPEPKSFAKQFSRDEARRSVQRLRETISNRFQGEADGQPSAAAQAGDRYSLFSLTRRDTLRSGLDVFRNAFSFALENHRPLLSRLLVGAAISNLFMLALPLFTMAVYDRVIPHQAMETLWALAIGVTIALALDLALRGVRLRLVDAVGLNTSLNLQAQFYAHLMKVKMSHAPRTSGGVAQYLRDLDAMCQLLPNLLVSLAVDIPFFVLVMVLLYSLGGSVVIAPLIGALALAGVYYLGHAGARRAYYESLKFNRQQTNMLIETVQGLELVKAANAEHKLQARWDDLIDSNSYTGYKSRLWSGFSSQSASTISQAVVVLVAIIGVYQIGAGAMTAGSLSASILLVGRGFVPVSQLIGLIDRLSHLNHAADGLVQFLNSPAEQAGDASAPRHIRGQIDVHNLSFTYEGAPAPCLQNVRLSIKPGEKIGIIGRVGSGKSTLLRVLMRLQDASTGSYLIDGYDAQQFDPTVLRNAFGYMRQDCILFDDTLMANILFGRNMPDAETFEHAVRISGVKDFASKNPQGFSVRVGPGGENLSGGERQSVSLARLLLGTPDVLLLDEPSAGLDATMEQRLVRDLRPHLAHKTLILATHRISMLALIDRLIVMEAGRIIADGPRDEVLQKLGQGNVTIANAV